jgi:PAS domain S-box-containing protein
VTGVLHLLASSGRYTHIDGPGHRRVPFGCYKIGRVASDQEPRFVSNDVQSDPNVHNHAWARELGLVSFAGYQLRTPGEETLGVLALFAKHPILADEDAMLDGVGSTVALVVKRAAAEQALHRSEERFREIVTHAGEGITFVDAAERFQFANPAAEAIFGVPANGLVGRSLKEFLRPEEFRRVLEETAKRRSGLKSSYELEIVRPDGATRQILVTASPSGEGEFKGALAVIRDITERKGAHEALRKSEMKYRRLYQSVRDAFATTDLSGRFLEFNGAYMELLGYTEEELRSSTYVDLTPAKWHAMEAEIVHTQVLPRGYSDVYEKEYRRKDGTIVPVELRTFLVRDDDEQPIAVCRIARDVTERKRAEEALRASRQMHDSIVEIVNVRVFWKDENLVFLGCNAAFARDAGYADPKDVIGKDDYQMGWRAQADLYRADDRQIIESGCPRLLVEERQTTAEGNTRTLLASKMPLRNSQGQISGVLGTYLDITERKRADDALRLAQQQLVQAQKLESIGQLAAGIAHEINTPIQYIGDNVRFLESSLEELSGVLQSCQLLASTEAAPTDEDLQRLRQAAAAADLPYLVGEMPKAIVQVLEGVEHVAKIVRAMREFSHPASAEKVVVDLNRVIENVITVSRNEWKYVADLTADFDHSIPAVPCLPDEFGQVILNLIVNASHAIAEVLAQRREGKGAIAVRTLRDGNWVKILVRDTGSGIPVPIRHRIFDPFFTTKDVGKGTGQGLAIAHDVVVNKHGGQITFETEVGVGTTFIIRMPLGGPGEPA